MNVAGTKDQTPLADPRLFLGGTLSEFETEDLERTEATYEIAQVRSDPAHLDVARARGEPVTRRASTARWVLGTALLGVGLLAGYAAGVATAIWNAEEQHAPSRSFPADRADSRSQRTDFPATVGGSSTGQIAEAVNKELRNSEPDSRPPQPESIDVLPRPVSPRVNRVPATGPGVLDLESRPTGAQVYLDDRLVTTTPFRLYDLPPGSHTIRMELAGYQPWAQSVNVEAGSRARITASLEP